jgi:hypothetical protein
LLVNLIYVGLGGFIGAALRYLTGGIIGRFVPHTSFPYGTFVVNILGCLLIGLLAGLADTREIFTTTAHAYIDLLKVHGIRISMAAVGKAEENGYAERVVRTIKEEEVDLSEYFSFADAARQIGHFIEVVYMTKRIHSSLLISKKPPKNG